MLRTIASRRTFVSAARLYEDKTLTEKAAETVKKVAGAFKSDGAVGKEFNADGKAGGKAQEVGGPLSADGKIGKQFTNEGAIGGTADKVLDKTQQKAEEKKADSTVRRVGV